MKQELDYTQLSLFTMCARKYWYIYQQCLEHMVGNAAHFSSELIHPSISAWYEDVNFDWGAGWKRFVEVAPIKGDEFYTQDRARAVYERYIEEYGSDKEEYELIVTEISASTPLSSGDRFISKPDLVLRDKSTGKVGVVDIKTSKWPIGANLIPFDRQFLGQVKLIGAEWMMKTHVQILKTKMHLTRDWHQVTPDLLEEWEAEVEMVYKWIALCHETGVWPKNAPGACTAFNSACEFMNLCNAGKLKESLMEQMPRVDSFAYLRKG